MSKYHSNWKSREAVIEDARQADHVSVGVDIVLVGLAQCPNAIFECRTAVAEDESRGQPAIEILTRDDLVTALLGKEVEPFVELCHIDQRAVLGEEVEDGAVIDPHRTAPAGSIPRSSA